MSQSTKLKAIDYPFGNPQPQQQQDTESYHSVNNDDRKLRYFDDDQRQGSFSKKGSQSMLKKKNPLPPVYPYEQMKKLKQSIRLNKKGINESQVKQGGAFDTQSIRSVDSFHTANQFQSICYEEGDYEKIVGQMKQNQYDEKQKELKKQQQRPNQEDKHKQQEKIVSGMGSFQAKDFKHESQQIDRPHQIKVGMQQSHALDQAQLLQLQESQLSEQKYEKFELTDREQRKADKREQQQEQKSVQISRIQQVLNQSVQLDQQILQLTRQLQQAHSPQQQILLHRTFNGQHIKKQQQLNQRYQSIQKRMVQLQKGQKNFTKQIQTISQILRRTQQNNNYLKKQVEFFKSQVKSYQQRQKQLQQRRQNLHRDEQLNSNYNKSIINNHNNSSSPSIFSTLQQKQKPKTYNIRPKTANNQSYQSRKYKQLTFQYCMRQHQQQVKIGEQQNWLQLQIDRENSPSQYKIVYSFQQQNTLLVVRLIDVLQQHAQQMRDKNKDTFIPPSSSSSAIKKNYQYMMDFAHNKYQNQQQKLHSLTKQLILHLNHQSYTLKEFTKKIQLFLIITEEQTYIDLVKIIPLPNPIAFYIERRFDKLINQKMNIKINQKPKSQLSQNSQNKRQQQKSLLNNNNNNTNPIIYKNILNLHKLMKTYIIKIQHMADVQSVQKLMSLQWINTNSNIQPKYFSITYKQKLQNSQCIEIRNQLFYVKIQDCVLEQLLKGNTTGDKQRMDRQQYRYSLVFKVASNVDNGLLVDLIEFLTFLTVM